MITKEEIDTTDLDMLDDPYQHLTCNIVYPRGSLKLGDTYKTACGKTTILRRCLEKCPECMEMERVLKDLTVSCPVCGRAGRDH